MKNSYRDAMDALRFTPEQKADMVENLLSAPAAGKVVRPLRFRRFAAAGAAAALVLSLGVAAVALIFIIKKFLHTEEDDGAAAGKRPPETPAH